MSAARRDAAARRGAARRRAAAGRCAGFTLIEILVALAVFVSAIGGVLALMTTALAMHRDGLELSRVASEMEGVTARLRQEVAAGRHRGEGEAAWRDVPPTRLEGGLWHSVAFRTAAGGEVVGDLRLAESAKALERARAVPVGFGHGLLERTAVERFPATTRR